MLARRGASGGISGKSKAQCGLNRETPLTRECRSGARCHVTSTSMNGLTASMSLNQALGNESDTRVWQWLCDHRSWPDSIR
jgi:hypothetical protein